MRKMTVRFDVSRMGNYDSSARRSWKHYLTKELTKRTQRIVNRFSTGISFTLIPTYYENQLSVYFDFSLVDIEDLDEAYQVATKVSNRFSAMCTRLPRSYDYDVTFLGLNHV